MHEQMDHDVKECGRVVHLHLAYDGDDLFLQPPKFLDDYRLPSDDIEEVTEVSQRCTDVRFHYPSNCNGNYLRHHDMTVMKIHPAEDFFRRVEPSFYQRCIAHGKFDS